MSTEIPAPSWKRTRPPAAARVALTQDAVVDTAIRLLDRDGLDGVSMRRVAEELNTGAASLYAHIANKEELLDLMLDRVIGEAEVPEPDPEHWQEQLHGIGMRMYEIYGAHRDIAVVSLANIPTGPNALKVAERTLAILLAGGVPPQVAAWALDRLALYIAADAYEGSLLSKRQVESGLPMEEFVEKFTENVREFYANLPADRFPSITTHLGDLVNGDGRQRFAFGLDMLIRSLATYASPTASPSQPTASPTASPSQPTASRS